MSLPTLATIRPHVALVTILAGASACASGPSQTPGTAALTSMPTAGAQAASAPVLLSCPAGQQALMRQVEVAGAVVPQVECVSTAPLATPALNVAAPMAMASPLMAGYAPAPAVGYVPAAATPVRTRTATPQARRVVYDDDIVEYRRPSRRSWQKSAVIIGSAAGAGAGVGALTGGKKGALIGAAVGGGAATVWDQITRRQPR
jgi:hypothetical protein